MSTERENKKLEKIIDVRYIKKSKYIDDETFSVKVYEVVKKENKQQKTLIRNKNKFA
ncbi:MAG: hypothetical protein RR335_10615 [Eubacterium sp.]